MAKKRYTILATLSLSLYSIKGFQLQPIYLSEAVTLRRNGFFSKKLNSETSPTNPNLTFIPFHSRQCSHLFNQDQSQDQSVDESMNPATKASWYAVEVFGKIFGQRKTKSAENDSESGDNMSIVDLTKPPSSLSEAFQRIQLDNNRSYFLSGEVDVLAYDPDCIFSDPFVAFSGRERFVDNLANLGSFITEYDAKLLKYDTDSDPPKVQTKVMVKLELNLPWKPILAWPWGVTYNINPETFLITEHIES